MTKEAKKAAKLEKKLKILTGGYQVRMYNIFMHSAHTNAQSVAETLSYSAHLQCHAYIQYIHKYVHAYTHQIYTHFVLLIGCF